MIKLLGLGTRETELGTRSVEVLLLSERGGGMARWWVVGHTVTDRRVAGPTKTRLVTDRRDAGPTKTQLVTDRRDAGPTKTGLTGGKEQP